MGCMSQLIRVRRDETLRAVEALVADAWAREGAEFRTLIVGQLGAPRGFRNPHLKEWPEARVAVVKAIRLATARSVACVVQACTTASDRVPLARYYRQLGVGREGMSDEEVSELHEPVPSCDSYVSAWSRLDERDRLGCAIFTATIADVGIVRWRSDAHQAMESVILPALAASQTTPVCTTQASAETLRVPSEIGTTTETPTEAPEPVNTDVDEPVESAEDAREPAPQAPRPRVKITPLDQVIMDLVVQAVGNQHGAKSPDVLAGIIDEVVTLNIKRVQSRFHIGLLAALNGGDLPGHRPDDNNQRRAWLIAGWLMGHHRLEPTTSLSRYAELTESDRSQFIGDHDASEGTASEFVAQLIKQGDVSPELLMWIQHAGPSGLAAALAFVKQLHDASRAKEALEVCTAVLQSVRDYPTQAEVAELMLSAMLLQSKSLRITGQFADAEGLLEALEQSIRLVLAKDMSGAGGPQDVLESAQVPWAMRHGIAFERLLCALRAGHSWDVWIPTDPSDRATLNRLEGCRDLMRQCLGDAEGAMMLGAAYLLGLWCVLRGKDDVPDGFPIPLQTINESLAAHMAGQTAGSDNPLRARLELLAALLSVGDGGARTANAVEAIAHYERNFEVLPFHAVAEAIECALLEEAESAWQLVLPRLGSDFNKFVDGGMIDLCLKNRRLVQEVLSARERIGDQLDGQDRVRLMCELFTAATRQPGISRADLTELADELIMRVSEFPGGARLALETFCAEDRWSRVWKDEDFTAVRAGLAGWCPEDVRQVERSTLFIRATALAKADPDTALELIDYCEYLGEPHDNTLELRARIKRLEDRPAVASVGAGNAPRVRVLFVGGDQRQRNAEAAIRERVTAQRPNTTVVFIYPGWSANWGHALDRASNAVDGADIVVMLRFMRTLFGEGLRKAVNGKGKQWRPTYGHAPPSISRAIVQAANDLAIQREGADSD
jgi:hypothetical protein